MRDTPVAEPPCLASFVVFSLGIVIDASPPHTDPKASRFEFPYHDRTSLPLRRYIQVDEVLTGLRPAITDDC